MMPVADRMIDIHHRYSAALHRFLLRLANGERQTAEDLFQETMLHAWRRIDAIPADEEGTRRWLFTIARRVVIDAVRMRQCRPREVHELNFDIMSGQDDTYATAIATHSVVAALAALTATQRGILSAVFLHGRSPERIASETGLPIGTVKSRTHYALRALRSRLDA
jgi:RNA polymerase sigma factor (sigma-70 family)